MKDQTYVSPEIVPCEQELIQLIPTIQSHGCIIGVCKDELTIKYGSENLYSFFKIKNVIGEHISKIDQAINDPLFEKFISVQLRANQFLPQSPYKITILNKQYNLLCYELESLIVLELEPSADTIESLKTKELLGETMVKLSMNVSSLTLLLQQVSDQLKEMLGFDRVMVYKFWEDWHGEIIAESKESFLEPFLGLHYPASDIPKQARQLYEKNVTRLIADVDSVPNSILALDDKPLDLTMSQLRSVSPIHIEYLKNMGVKASYSISILRKGKLWGLIACHNNTPKFIDFERRKSTEIISNYLSNIIEITSTQKTNLQFKKSNEILEALDAQMREDWDIIKGLFSHTKNLGDLIGCPGSALSFNGEIHTIGKTPSLSQIKEILTWLKKNKGDEFVTTNLSSFITSAHNYTKEASGLFALCISKELNEYLLFFKPEQIENIHWAGKHQKGAPKEYDGTIRYSPRKSFEKFSRQVLQTSESWHDWELASARALKNKIINIIQIRTNEIRRLNEKLSEAYNELDAFSYTLSHDLKTPLHTIGAYMDLLEEEKGADLKENFMFSKMRKNTQLMGDMIKSVLEYSKLGRDELVTSKVKILNVVERIVDQINMNRKFSNFILDIPSEISVDGNATMIYQVLLNIIDNAVKYSFSSSVAEVRIIADRVDNSVKIRVSDNGIGMEEKYFSSIFNLFSRIPTNNNIEGSGVGLAISKKIMDKHNGYIDVSSEKGKGSIFTLVFKS